MLEYLRERIETALDWFPNVKVISIYFTDASWVVILDTPGSDLVLDWPDAWVRAADDLALVTEVRYWLMKERE